MEESGGLERLKKQAGEQAEACKLKGRELLEHRAAYSALVEKLRSLPDKTSHQVMVPLTSKAFMRGHLVHTNEVLVLLGDNWFMEASAKKAAEVAARRLQECDKILEKLEEELKRVEGWAGSVGGVAKEREQCVDIKEEVGEEELSEWRLKHRESVRRERGAQAGKGAESHDEVMRRLEELEVREALEEQWAEEESDDEEEDESDEDESDGESDEEVGDNGDEFEETLGESGPMVAERHTEDKNRRISWAFGEGEDPSLPSVNPRLELVFSHSEQQSPLTSPPSGQVPLQPSDLPHFTCPSPRPILKPSTAPILVQEEDNTGEEEEEDLEIPEPFEDPCSSMVLEKPAKENILSKDLLPKEEEEEEAPKKVSKFKAMRAGRK